MLSQDTSVFLFILLYVNIPHILTTVLTHLRRRHIKYDFSKAEGWSRTFYEMAIFAYLFLAGFLIAGGTLNYDTVDWENGTRVSAFWTFSAGNLFFLIFLDLFFVGEELGLGLVSLTLSFVLTVVSFILVATYSNSDTNTNTALGLLAVAAGLLFLYLIMTALLYSGLDSIKRRKEGENCRLLPSNRPRGSRSHSSKKKLSSSRGAECARGGSVTYSEDGEPEGECMSEQEVDPYVGPEEEQEERSRYEEEETLYKPRSKRSHRTQEMDEMY